MEVDEVRLSRRAGGLAGVLLVLAVGYVLLPRPGDETTLPRAGAFEARVFAVPDGDTLRVRTARGARHTVRIQNVECPELRPNDNCRGDARRGGWSCERQREPARRARRWVRERVLGTTVRVLLREADPSSGPGGDRLIARVRHEGDDLGERLVEAGLCRPWLKQPPRGPVPPY